MINFKRALMHEKGGHKKYHQKKVPAPVIFILPENHLCSLQAGPEMGAGPCLNQNKGRLAIAACKQKQGKTDHL